MFVLILLGIVCGQAILEKKNFYSINKEGSNHQNRFGAFKILRKRLVACPRNKAWDTFACRYVFETLAIGTVASAFCGGQKLQVSCCSNRTSLSENPLPVRRCLLPDPNHITSPTRDFIGSHIIPHHLTDHFTAWRVTISQNQDR